jgi:hypothetical protein
MSGFTSDLGASFSPSAEIQSRFQQFMQDADSSVSQEVKEAKSWLSTLNQMLGDLQNLRSSGLNSNLDQRAADLIAAIKRERKRTQSWINKHEGGLITRPGPGGYGG